MTKSISYYLPHYILPALAFSIAYSDEHSVATQSQETTQTPQSAAPQSLFSTQGSLDIGIDSTQIQANGWSLDTDGNQFTSTINLHFTGPNLKFRQAFLFENYAFLDLSADATVGTAESLPSYSDNGEYGGRAGPHTFSFQIGAEGRLGGNFEMLNKRLALRPYVGFGYNKYRSKIVSVDSNFSDFPLIAIDYYRPSIGCDWVVTKGDSNVFGGLGVEMPWADFQLTDPEDSIRLEALPNLTNKTRAARMGLRTSIGGTLQVSELIALTVRGDYYSIYSRGAPQIGVTSGSYEPTSVLVQSIKGTVGITVNY